MANKMNVELSNYSCPAAIPLTDSLHRKSRDKVGPWAPSQASKMLQDGRGPLTEEEALLQMEKFFDDYYADTETSLPVPEKNVRVAEALVSMEMDGYYEHTVDEITWAAKTAWRNAPRCVGRDIWRTLTVVDERKALSCEEIFTATCKNLRRAFNGGQINPSAVVFRQRYGKDKHLPGIRVWNGVLLSFAGFVKENGDVIGDPKNVYFTNLAKSLGWKPKEGMFELLPLIITDANQKTEVFELPDDIKGYTVNISHPTEPEITKLGLKWYGIPSVSSMMLEAGGIQYTCCQIAGFFQDTEISVMNLLGESRYNLMEPIGRLLQLDVSMNSTYWKCTVATELTRAVYHSFKLAQVSIIDHFSLADNFSSFMKEEVRTRGGCPADWLWVVPPMSSGLVPTFHTEMLRYFLSPSYEYQSDPQSYFKQPRKKLSFRVLVKSIMYFLDMMRKHVKERKNITVVYATEGGTALTFASIAESYFLKAFNVSILPISDITVKDDLRACIDSSDVVIIVASCFGSGGPPSMAKEFQQNLLDKAYCFEGMKFAVFALGSSQYKNTFAQFGQLADREIEEGGGKRLAKIGFGDDQANQRQAFEKWITSIYEICCLEYLPSSMKIQSCVKSTEEATFNKIYRWRYGDKRSINECFQDRVGSSAKVLEFTIKDKINLSTKGQPASDKYYLITLSYTQKPGEQAELFLPGQHIGIFPKNLSFDKDRVLENLHGIPFRLPLILEEKVAAHGTWRPWKSHYSGLTLDEFLCNVTDLNRIPDDWEKLLKTENLKSGGTKNSTHQSLASKPDDLSELECAKFIGKLPTIKRRQFSIASCQKKSNTVKILIAMHEFEKNGKKVAGLTSNFLRHAPLGEKIQSFFIKSNDQMQLPQDPNLPLLLVSAGSGFAPFMSFIEFKERAARAGTKSGPILIFHGCRYKEHDFLDQLLKRASKVLTIVTFRAYSRTDPHKLRNRMSFRTICRQMMGGVPGPLTMSVKKGYVQDMIAEQGDIVANIARDGGYIYTCGGTGMVNAARSQLKRTLKECGRVSLQDLIESKRFQEEKFG